MTNSPTNLEKNTAIEAVASFLKERDENVLPDEADDEERKASAQCIVRVVAKFSSPTNLENAERAEMEPKVKAEDLRMSAYYYGFEPTGVYEIDVILSAVATAGKAFHHTENWQEDCAQPAPFKGTSPVEWIQNAANDAAVVFSPKDQSERATFEIAARLLKERDALRRELEEARKAHRETLDLLHIRNEKLNAAEAEIERLRVIALDMQAGYLKATARVEEAVKAANALQIEVDRLRAVLSSAGEEGR